MATAPALTMGVLAAAGSVFTGTGLRWQPVTVGLATLVAAAVAAGLARPWRQHPPVDTDPMPAWAWWQHAGIGAVLVAAGSLGVRATYQVTGSFDDVNQTWDAFFHAGAVRFIAESGNPDPAALSAIAAQASTSFFAPNAYHATAALIQLSSGAAVVPVLNVMAAVLPLLLGLGLVGLFRVTTRRPAHAAAVALFAAGVAVVPYHLVGYGTLLPYGTALVLLPGTIALVAAMLRAPGRALGAALGLAAAGLLGVHPQVALLAALVAALQTGWQVTATRRIDRPLVAAVGSSLLLFVLVGGPVLATSLTAVSGAAGIDWPAYQTPAGALGDLLLFSSVDPRLPQWWFVPLLLVGLTAVAARGSEVTLRPLLAAAVVVAGLYLLAGAYDGALSLRLTSLWWNDRHRLAAAFGVLALVFVAVGAVQLRDWLARLVLAVLPAAPPERPALRLVPAALLVVGLLGFVVVTEGNYAPAVRNALASGYGQGPTLSDEERAGLARVDQLVRDGGGGLVMNDPHDGCAWAYPLYGTEMVFPTPLTGPFDWANLGHDRQRLYESFDELDTDRQVRQDSQRLDIRWAVTCTGFIRTWQTRAPGLDDLRDLRSAELVYANRAVQLFRLGRPAETDGR